MQNEKNEAVLEEIFIPASHEIIENRFSVESNEAACKGTCVSGSCKAVTE